MRIANLDIKPILIYLPDTPEWMERWKKGKAHLEEQGIDDIFHLCGIHGEAFGVAGTHIYLADGRPEEKFYIGSGKVAGNLTQYMSFVVMDALDYTHFWSIEDDLRLPENWRERMEAALRDVPEDFDVLFMGSCCTQGKEATHIKGDIYHYPYRGEEKKFWYPQCSHSLLFAKKCIPYLIQTNRDVANPSDVSLVISSFPKLNIYAVHPRIGEQEGTFLPE